MKVEYKESASLPFILNFVEKIDDVAYKKAVDEYELLIEKYDPKTQTSNIPVYAGTSLTYRSTGTGNIVFGDTEPDEDDA